MRTIQSPIQNRQLLNSIAEELNKKNEQYYLIFQLILETGMPLECIPQLTISDIKSNPLSFTPTHKFIVRKEYISETLSRHLIAYAGNRDDDALAFHSIRDENKRFPLRNFQRALDYTTKILSLDQTITVLAIRKTYLLNLFLKSHDYHKIYALTDCRSVRDVLEYLNLGTSELGDTRQSSYTIKESLINKNLVEKTIEHSFQVLSEISKNIKENDINLPSEYFAEVLKQTTDIEASLTRFEDISNNSNTLKDIYTKKVFIKNLVEQE